MYYSYTLVPNVGNILNPKPFTSLEPQGFRSTRDMGASILWSLWVSLEFGEALNPKAYTLKHAEAIAKLPCLGMVFGMRLEHPSQKELHEL